ncbi:MAG: hypothetical protein CL907_05115 [Dehalococcoidia bacterium]|nr:hypothetical protein [Dehalococcoidia bacterium]|tara:strand:+ start:18124 stop:19599 length:1476 start_codon:yes stop_codon:yes gene_type:complete
MPSKSSKSSSIRPRDTNLKPIKIKSEVRSASERGTSSPLIVVYGFLALILFGAILLFLPFSHNEPISFIDSLFTATSASTVTGLTVLDTSTSWSLFGQIVIAFLIVIGGIGFMTGAAFFLLAAGQSLGLRRSVQIGEGLGADNLGSIGNLVWKVVLSSLSFQIAGIFIFFILFSYSYGFSNIQQNAWYSIFHSISSFNNAGFTIFGFGNNLEPFSRGAVNNIVLIVTTVMFFFGGIGYFVMNDLVHHRRILGSKGFRRFRVLLSLETKLILAGSLVLSFAGAILIYLFEFSNPNTLGSMTLTEKIINSIFTSMSTRTAGFNSFDMSQSNDYTNLVCTFLMFIGGGPASTAGGIKITTFILAVLMIMSHIRGSNNISFFGREIPYDIGVRAMVILILSIFIIGVAVLVTLFIEFSNSTRDHYFVHLVFDTISAFSTNGMSTGSSQDISNTSKILFSFIMFIGRLGPMTLALLLAGSQKPVDYRFFQEKVRIG